MAEAVATYSLTSTKLCSGRHSGDRRLIALRTINAQCMRTRVTGYSSLFVCLYVCYHSSASLRHVCNKLNLPARSLLHSKGFQLTNFAKRKNVSIFFNNIAFHVLSTHLSNVSNLQCLATHTLYASCNFLSHRTTFRQRHNHVTRSFGCWSVRQ